jgi:MFS family permease
LTSLGASVFEAGFVISLSGVVGTVLICLSGAISDRIGKRRTILVSCVLSAVPSIFYLLATDWRELVPWAIVYGIAFALFMPARNALVADLVEPEERASAFSFLILTFQVGRTLGPTLEGVIVDWLGWKYLFMMVATFHIFSLMPAIAIRDEKRAAPDREKPHVETDSRDGWMKVAFLLIVLQFLFALGFGIVNPIFPAYLSERFGSTATEIGFFSSIGWGLTASLVQIFSAKLAGRISGAKLILYCSSVMPFTFLFWPSGSQYLELLVLYAIAAGAWTMTWSPILSMLMGTVPTSKRGLFSGLFEAGIMGGYTIGPTVAGILWKQVGHHTPLYVSSLIFALSVPTALLLYRSTRAPKQY